jgi:hypothetical protein
VTRLNNKEQTFAIFVIHSFEDLSLVKKIRDNLKVHSNIRFMVAEWKKRLGEPLGDKIIEFMQSCQVVLVLWSHNLEKSVLANQEIGYAVALGKRIFPFVARGMIPKGFLQGTEYIEYDPFDVEKDIEILVEEITTFAQNMGYHV